MDIRLNSQKGRSMLEMLSIVLIISLLTISAIWGMGRLLNKTRANRIIHDGQLVYLDAVSNTENLIKNKNNWMTPSTITESHYPFFYMVDFIGNPYVKVEDVKKETCVLLLDMQSDELKFYTTENEEFTTCQEGDNAIVIDYTGTGLPRECSGYSDCEGAGSSTFCSAQGQCEVCEGGHQRNAEGNGCRCFDEDRDPDKDPELTCSDAQGNTWCCGRDEEYEQTICGSKKGECIRSEGTCSYQVSAQTQTKSANCSYQVSAQTQTKSANCSYRVSTQTQIKSANCSYSVSDSGDVTPAQDCTGENEYCYLSFAKQDCSSSAGADISGTIYGTCISQTSNSGAYCNVASETEAVTPLVDCPASTYCYLNWSAESCSSTAGAGITGPIYGVCAKKLNNSPYCPY